MPKKDETNKGDIMGSVAIVVLCLMSSAVLSACYHERLGKELVTGQERRLG